MFLQKHSKKFSPFLLYMCARLRPQPADYPCRLCTCGCPVRCGMFRQARRQGHVAKQSNGSIPRHTTLQRLYLIIWIARFLFFPLQCDRPFTCLACIHVYNYTCVHVFLFLNWSNVIQLKLVITTGVTSVRFSHTCIHYNFSYHPWIWQTVCLVVSFAPSVDKRFVNRQFPRQAIGRLAKSGERSTQQACKASAIARVWKDITSFLSISWCNKRSPINHGLYAETSSAPAKTIPLIWDDWQAGHGLHVAPTEWAGEVRNGVVKRDGNASSSA